MTRDETKGLIAIMVSLYPNFKPDNISATIDAWHAVIKDQTLKDMQNCLMVYAKTDRSGFAPSVGQLLNYLDNEPNADEEWMNVRMAIRNCGYDEMETFKKLSPRAQAAVGSPSQLKIWGQMETSFVETAVAKTFKTAYAAIQERERRNFIAPSLSAKMTNLLEKKGETE